MKYLINTLFLSLLVISATGQTDLSKDVEVKKLTTTDGANIQFVGDQSLEVADAIFAHFDVQTNKPVKRIKKVEIEGLDHPITLQVHRGYYGVCSKESKENSSCGRSYYSHTFSKKYSQQWFEENARSNESYTTLIYFKHDGKYGVESDEEYEIIKKFLTSII